MKRSSLVAHMSSFPPPRFSFPVPAALCTINHCLSCETLVRSKAVAQRAPDFLKLLPCRTRSSLSLGGSGGNDLSEYALLDASRRNPAFHSSSVAGRARPPWRMSTQYFVGL